MNVLIDIGHPAHVHVFRNLIFELKTRNHKVIVTVKKNISSAVNLLKLFEIDFIELGDKNDSIGGKFISQIKFDFHLLKIAKRNKIDLMLGTSITIAHVTFLSGIKSIVFDDDDDEVQPLMTKFGHPFASLVLTPDVLKGKRKKKKTFYYPSYHELAYLHPNRFTPDPNILKEIGLKEGDAFFILRFNAFKAHHDIGVQGISIENKRQLISHLEQYGRVFITTEKNIDEEFLKYQLKVSPEKAHSLIYYATMLIGDSQTMTSEAAVLGTPSLRSNSFVGRIAYLEEEEHKYQLTFGFLPENFENLEAKLDELLSDKNLKSNWDLKRKKMLADKIDGTTFYLWLVENFPNSIKEINPEISFWKKFKTNS
jgi:uncharacterized protein